MNSNSLPFSRLTSSREFYLLDGELVVELTKLFRDYHWHYYCFSHKNAIFYFVPHLITPPSTSVPMRLQIDDLKSSATISFQSSHANFRPWADFDDHLSCCVQSARHSLNIVTPLQFSFFQESQWQFENDDDDNRRAKEAKKIFHIAAHTEWDVL